MSNRYSKTGFTKREDEQLLKIEVDLLNLIERRNHKYDSPLALSKLFAAQAAISDARYQSKEWKKWK